MYKCTTLVFALYSNRTVFFLFYLQCLRDMEFMIIGQRSVEPIHLHIGID